MNRPTNLLLRFLALTVLLCFALRSSSFADIGPIDFVYTWVDGDDEDWLKLREQWKVEEGMVTSDGTSVHRFRDRDELRYSLRSAYYFAPFVNKIYIVTNGQVPQWLRSHPKIKIVTHKEIFPNQRHLPTFNSMAIECHLHKIPGLSENYVYFNDDMFLGRKILPSDLFTKDGKMKVFFSTTEAAADLPFEGEIGYRAACKNTNILLNGLYGKEKRRHISHMPYIANKSVVKAIERKFFHLFELVSSHKFRSYNDYTITNGIIPNVAYYMGKAIKTSIDYKLVAYGKNLAEDGDKLGRLLKNPCAFFCINDCSPDDSKEAEALLKWFFSKYFPNPAPWENLDQ